MTTTPEAVSLPSQEPMLAAVGKGIQAFSGVEMGLGILFASLMEPADRVLSIVALDAARHIETKTRIVRSIVQTKLTGSDLAKANNLINRIGKKADFRNKLAHWTVSYWPSITTAKDIKKIKVVLIPPPASPLHMSAFDGGKDSKAVPLTERDLMLFVKDCGNLTKEFFDLQSALSVPK